MKAVGRREVALFSSVVRKLYSPATASSFPAQLVAALRAVIGNCVTIDDIKLERRYSKKQDNSLPITRAENSAQRANQLVVAQISDLITLREFRPPDAGSAAAQSAVDHRIYITLPGHNHITRLTFRRQGNFSKRELKVLELLSPHIAQAHANAEGRRAKEQSTRRRIARERREVRLTPREAEVLRWVAEGKRNREIGVILNTSSRTVQKQVQSILDKLCVETRCGAAAWWFEERGQATDPRSTAQFRRSQTAATAAASQLAEHDRA